MVAAVLLAVRCGGPLRRKGDVKDDVESALLTLCIAAVIEPPLPTWLHSKRVGKRAVCEAL